MIHHVSLEIDPADVGRSTEFWTLIGFRQVEPPADMGSFTWFERGGTQIHLMPVDSPVVPTIGHVAVVVPEYERSLERLGESGFEVSAKRERWGSPRAEAIAPGGHRVELMESPPAPQRST